MKLLNKIRGFGRKSKFAVAVLAIGIVAAPFAKAEFYPARPVFDYNKASVDCSNPNDPGNQGGRCGSMNGPVFNSFVNTPSYGDERAFFDGRRTDTGNYSFADDIQDVNKGSKEVILQTYVHNNANQTTNASGVGIAHNTKVRIALPTAEEQVLRARSYISADNAAMVEDTVDFLGTEKFKVEYIPGSAVMRRSGAAYPVSDSIVTTGAQIGDKTMNGEFPGCFDYAALVEIRVRIVVQETPNLQFFKEVRKAGDTQWSKEVSAKPNDVVDWKLATKNISNYDITNVIVRDVLPPHVKLVPGSVRIVDASQDTVQQDGPLFAGGFITANKQQPGGIRYVTFKTTTLGDFEACQTRVRNVAFSKSDQQPTEQQSSADVIITRENCKPDEQKPVYSCDALKVVKGSNRTATYNTTVTARNGATVKNYVYDFGDGNTLTTDKASVNHTYTKDGKYAARVKVNFAVNNQTVSDEGDRCAAAVEFTTPGTPGTPGTTVGTTPTTLPETGAGSTIAIFVAVTVASTGAYYVIARRFSQL